MVGYEVITSALREEAKRWDGFAAEVKQVEAAIASLDMSVVAFFMVDPSVVGRLLSIDTAAQAPIHATAYEGFRSKMEELTGGAVTEFGQIGDALIKMAKEYDEAQRISELDFEEIYRA